MSCARASGECPCALLRATALVSSLKASSDARVEAQTGCVVGRAGIVVHGFCRLHDRGGWEIVPSNAQLVCFLVPLLVSPVVVPFVRVVVFSFDLLSLRCNGNFGFNLNQLWRANRLYGRPPLLVPGCLDALMQPPDLLCLLSLAFHRVLLRPFTSNTCACLPLTFFHLSSLIICARCSCSSVA